MASGRPVWSLLISVLLHLLLLGGLTFISFGQNVENPVVQVQLVEIKVPESASSMMTDRPPMMAASRSLPQSVRHLSSPPMPRLIAPQIMKQASVKPVSQLKHREPLSPRRVLQDTRASDISAMQRLLEVAKTSEPPSSPQVNQPVTLPATPVLNTAFHSIPSITAPPMPSTPLPPSHASRQRSLAMHPPPEMGGMERSNVGLQRMIPPLYPRAARQQRWEGTVLVRVVVRPDGRPRDIAVLQSSGHEILDRAAIDAVQSWLFVPARDGNIPITSRVEVPIRFNLSQHG